MENLEGYVCEVRSSGKLAEARLIRILRNLAKCGSSGTDVNNDKT